MMALEGRTTPVLMTTSTRELRLIMRVNWLLRLRLLLLLLLLMLSQVVLLAEAVGPGARIRISGVASGVIIIGMNAVAPAGPTTLLL